MNQHFRVQMVERVPVLHNFLVVVVLSFASTKNICISEQKIYGEYSFQRDRKN